jgi:hypothetical protein
MTANPDVTRRTLIDVVLHVSGVVCLELFPTQSYLPTPRPLEPRRECHRHRHPSPLDSAHPDAGGTWLVAP